MTVFFYVSSHGFGHAVRQAAILDALVRLAPPSLRIVLRTGAPAWLFDRLPQDRVSIEPAGTDAGVAQIDALRPDEAQTIARAGAFHAQAPARIAAETERLRAGRARLVVTDVPSLPCAAAAAAGVPSVVCSNFTWDWIYAGYADRVPDAARVADAIGADYAKATAAWRLPMHGGFETIDRIVDLPFVVRPPVSSMSGEEIRRALGLPVDRPVVLASFGGYDVKDLPLDRLDCTDEWTAVLTPPSRTPDGLPDGVIGISPEALSTHGIAYQDLVRAVDVVLSKPGYGIVADCLGGGTPLLYTPRGRFREYDVLVREMPKVMRCRELDAGAFYAGAWRAGLNAVRAADTPPDEPRLDGAETIARLAIEAAT